MFIRPVKDHTLRSKVLALDALNTKVMVADADLKIIYMNPSVIAMMHGAEAEMKKELPRFSVDTLMGSNIDVFHKSPDHQRHILARLQERHAATITVGSRKFDLLVSPLIENGERIGFVVEWGDAHARLQNLDYAAQLKAIGRSQATISFTTDGTVEAANENFLTLMGYTLAEVRGKNHSMFMDPEEIRGAAYAEFWKTLREGSFYASKFKRIAKNGQPVWIEASYNPILDETGRVIKVVKFMTDISAQRSLLANLTTSLKHIDDSVARSTAEAGAASTAATDTLSNVQSVAASAEQLAASVQEIAQSMAKSRDATEDVSAKAVAVGKSTEAMASAAQAMNGIVGLIRNVASQINLLALNATIEAARAGDAGKGFAVVASEVKNLAIQAARATEQITTEIDGLQSISADVARSIDGIRSAIGTVREQVTLTASAVEEQTAVTHGMSSSMHVASESMATVSTSINSIAGLVQSVAGTVSETRKAAEVLTK